ncbi:MAG: ATP-binding protein [Gammaproteobacteria bacterium]|nr:ATP-binding protein [Gammaproteobacteria bacterium]
MLEKLFYYEAQLLANCQLKFKRYLFAQLEIDDRLIAIVGARGTGKTTMLLQHALELKQLHHNHEVLYLTLDFPFLSNIDLFDFCEKFVQQGGKYLLIDEVHKYKEFSSHLKSVYDFFPKLKIIITGSCATSILNASADLSRRVTLYHLNGLSFREFLSITSGKELSVYSFNQIINEHHEITETITKEYSIEELFSQYLKYGYYPFYFDKQQTYLSALLETVNLTIDIDLVTLGLIEQRYTYKLKKLLEVVCLSNPFEINLSNIAAQAEISRVKLYDYLNYLDKGELILLVEQNVKGLKKISKPAKLFLNNSNLLYAFCDDFKIGTVRETFFVNQLKHLHDIKSAKTGDFIIDNKTTIEVGGKNKNFRQVYDIDDAYLAVDTVATDNPRKIPLWLFGFLY